jgi:hypothetical protein
MAAADFYEDLAWREMVYDGTEGLRDALAAGAITGYIGFDPTASSLHVGSLLPMLTLARLQRAGHLPIASSAAAPGSSAIPAQDAGADAADDRAGRRQRRGHPRAAGPRPRLRPRRATPRASSTTPTGWCRWT